MIKQATPITDGAEFFMESGQYSDGGFYVVRGDIARKLEADRAALIAALELVDELATNALDRAMPRNSATVSAIVQATRATLAKVQS